MYLYDEIDQRLVDERVAQFRGQTRRFLDGKLSEDEFSALRLRNGLYIQRYAPMLRIAIPYGLLSTTATEEAGRQLPASTTAATAISPPGRTCSSTGRRLEQVPEILAELATVQMHAIQTSGNCFRNVTTDHFAGVAQDEIVDSFVWCEILRQWSTFHPEFSYLPRKFKIAVNGAKADRAAVGVHDIGLHAVKRGDQMGFRVLVGGGLGRTPIVGHVIREFLPWPHLLTYLEAILRVYNRYGRRDNIHKARIKILVKERGPEKFREEVEAEWAHLKHGPRHADGRRKWRASRPASLDRNTSLCRMKTLQGEPAFLAWAKRNVHPHKVPGYAAVTLSLKKTGVPPGDVTSDQMDAIASLADRYSFGELRVSHEQNLVLADVRQRDLAPLWREARALGLATPNIGLLTNIITLPGRRLLRAGQRQVDPGRAGDPGDGCRRSGLPARDRRARPQHLRLHERLRPPPRRPHRHPRRG